MNLSFLIVVYHIHSRKIKVFILYLALCFESFYTSTFFFISFYFSYRSLSSKNLLVTKERLKRILIPYIIWPIIIFLFNNLYNYFNFKQIPFSIRDLIVQFIIGRKINDVFWFQFNLIFISIIIIIVIFLFSKNISYFFLLFIVFIAIIFDLKRFDVKIFGAYNIYIIQSVGKLSYSIIYSMTGFFLGSLNILEKINKNHKFKVLFFSPVFIYILKENKILFAYFIKCHFLIRDILITIIFVLYGSIPFELINNHYLIILIKQLTSFTGGIYYMHLFIGNFFKNFSDLI